MWGVAPDYKYHDVIYLGLAGRPHCVQNAFGQCRERKELQEKLQENQDEDQEVADQQQEVALEVVVLQAITGATAALELVPRLLKEYCRAVPLRGLLEGS